MEKYILYNITTSGGTLNVGTGSFILVNSSTTIALTSSFSIVPIVPLFPFVKTTIRWQANVLLNGFTVTIGGIQLPQDQINQPGTFELMYDGSGYTLQYFPDFSERPQEVFGVTTVNVPSIGGTLVISPGEDKRTYVLTASPPVTLSSNYTVSGSTTTGTPPLSVTDGSSIRVVISGGITIGSNTFTVFGHSISAYDCLNGGVEVYAEYNATTSSYVSTYINKNVPLEKLDTTGLGSGDDGKVVTYDNSIKEFVASYLSSSNFGVNFKGINFTETYITSGQLLTSNTTPITLLSPSGSLTEVEVPIMFVLRYKYGSTAYTTNTTIDIEYTGPAATELVASKNCLGFTVTGIDFLPPASVGTPHVRITPNYSLQLSTRTGDPLAGDGDLIVYTYSITLNI